MRHTNRVELLINLASVWFGIWFGTSAHLRPLLARSGNPLVHYRLEM